MLSLLLSTSALAGGYFYSDSGIVATGRGGAFVAGATGQFAQYYNPAGLIRVDRPTLSVGWSGVQQNVTFTRRKPDGTFYDPVRNEAAPFSVPELGFTTPLGSRVGFAFGFYSPFAPSSDYDPEGPQRYSVKDTLVYQFSVGPSVAVRLHPMLTLGLGLQWQYLQVGETVDVTVSGVDDPVGDVGVEAGVVDPFTPNLNGGLLFEPHPMLAFGASVQPPTRFRARGDLSLDFEGNGLAVLLDETRYLDDDVALNIGIPWVLRAGVLVRPHPRVEVELATVWQDWSSLADIVIEDIDVEIESTSPLVPEEDRQVDDTIELPAGLRDTVSLRLGAEARVHELLAVRAGGFWEGSALAEDEVSVALVDTPKVQLGCGASGFFLDEHLRLDASFAWLFFRSLEIRDSTVEQIDAGVFDTTVPLVVGNGDLESHGWVVGLAGSVAFGPHRRSVDE